VEIAQIYITDALSTIDESSAGPVTDVEREATDVATRYLTLIRDLGLRKAA
jgi:hypothetical protein